MSYEGLDIDLLNLGDADSILVTRWQYSIPTRILIDGGNSSDSQKVLDFLHRLGAGYLHHIVCSHPHDDHAAGLIGLVNSNQIDFGEAWLHMPQNHINFSALQWALSSTCTRMVRKIIEDSLATQRELEYAIRRRNKIIRELFYGQKIGFMVVCGPTEQFYEEQLAQFADLETLVELEEALLQYQSRIDREEYQQRYGIFAPTYLATEDIGLGEAPTEPENETSTVLGFSYNGHTYLLTADAGVQALTQVRNFFNLQELAWMQIPHHGSRRNVNEDLIQYFKPKVAYVSAAGNNKHPRRKVVNAFKKTGTQVYSTHYQGSEGGHLWHHRGTVPTRTGYGSAVALYDAGLE
ncbi:MAG: MBL fold metallo-hydrolase [Verrucomicrobia bacterium]|nr:MBL fold metallo-hydrolase [Verrucomicrobiota bacterium]MBV8277090.1 MBL fold metallo-hydrolase [Verrucomicrobiota bacterium]